MTPSPSPDARQIFRQLLSTSELVPELFNIPLRVGVSKGVDFALEIVTLMDKRFIPLVPSNYSNVFRYVNTKEDLARVWPLYERMAADASIPHPNQAYGFLLSRTSELGATEESRQIYGRLVNAGSFAVRTMESLFSCAVAANDRLFGDWVEAELTMRSSSFQDRVRATQAYRAYTHLRA